MDNEKDFVACLVTGFFPEVIQIEWKVDNKIATIKWLTDSVNQMEGGTYSAISRLEVSKVEWEEKRISCHAKHEAGDKEESTDKKRREAARTVNIPKHPECPPRDEDPPESMDEGTSSSSLRVATLTYTLLLMKSVLYCGIISFILYKVEYRDTKKPL